MLNGQIIAFAAGISAFVPITVGTIEAVIGTSFGLNATSELVEALLCPGKAIPMNMFRSYGYMSLMGTRGFSQELNLGHYAKVQPRRIFHAQLVATVISAVMVRYSPLSPPFFFLIWIVASGHHDLANR